jgi:lysyl-tRNA synthetase class 2
MHSTSLPVVPEVAQRLEVHVPRGATVLVCSDLHLDASATDASRAVTHELADRVAAVEGPATLVLDGDCFELLAGGTSVAAALDAHPDFEKALVRFVEQPDRSVVVVPGNHDGRLAWDERARAVVTSRVPSTVALSVDLLACTDAGLRVVRVEHGNRFDPANAFDDPFDPHETPLGHHVVQEVLPELERRPLLADARWLADADEFPRFLGSRVVYRELIGRLRWLAVPFLVALAVRTPAVVRGLSRSGDLRDLSRWVFVAGIGITVDALLFGAVALLLARRVFRSLATMQLARHGVHLNDAPRAVAEALCAQGFAGFVTGHTHHPELTQLGQGFYANSGCGVRAIASRPARAGLPPVFTGVLRRSWIEIHAGRELDTSLVVAETPVADTTRIERLAARGRPALPRTPTVVTTVPGGAGWPIDQRRLGVTVSRDRVRRVATALVLAAALIGVLSAVTPPLRGRLRGLLDLVPVELPQAASAALVFGSVGLLLVARGLRRGHRLAWTAAMALLAASAVLHLAKGVDVEEALVAVLVAAWLARNRGAFAVRPDTGAVRRAIVFAGVMTTAAVGAAFALVALVGAHQATGESLRALAERLAGDHALPLPSSSPFVSPALTAAGVAVVAVAGWVALGPGRPRRRAPAEHHADRERARSVVEHHGGDTLAYFALRDDKQWFFTGSAVVAYAVRNGVCLVSPDPIGPAGDWAETWAEFRSFADQRGWSVAVVGARPSWLPVYEAGGMRAIYMGDEAIVDCQAFTLDGGHMKSLRGAYNRVKKAGYTCVFLDPAHLEHAIELELRDLMTQTRQGETERGFSMTLSRIFDPDDTGLLLSVALDPDGRPAAFCQWTPAADIDGWSLDLMRRRADPDLPNGVTDFVVIETIQHVKAAHQWGLGLNFAVMRAVVAGEREGGFYELERRVLHKFSETMQIESLWRYNEKYRPAWRPRYVVVDAVEHAAAQGIAIADAESIWELPVLGRFLGHR